MRWQELHEAVRPEDWLESHVNRIVKTLKAEGRISADPVSGLTPARSSLSRRIRFCDSRRRNRERVMERETYANRTVIWRLRRERQTAHATIIPHTMHTTL